MICPQCGAQNADTAQVCTSCGAALATQPPVSQPPPPYYNVYGQPVQAAPAANQSTGTSFCRQCGQPLYPGAPVCSVCGVSVGAGTNYCPYCGHPAGEMATYCARCGMPLMGYMVRPDNRKSKLAAGLLGLFLGGYGVHNFYLGYTGKAVAQLLMGILGTLLSCLVLPALALAASSIWGLVEGIMILAGAIRVDGHGVPLRD